SFNTLFALVAFVSLVTLRPLQPGLSRRPLIAFGTLWPGWTLLAFRSHRTCHALLAFRAGDSRNTWQSLITLRALWAGWTLFTFRALLALSTRTEQQGRSKKG